MCRYQIQFYSNQRSDWLGRFVGHLEVTEKRTAVLALAIMANSSQPQYQRVAVRGRQILNQYYLGLCKAELDLEGGGLLLWLVDMLIGQALSHDMADPAG